MLINQGVSVGGERELCQCIVGVDTIELQVSREGDSGTMRRGKPGETSTSGHQEGR